MFRLPNELQGHEAHPYRKGEIVGILIKHLLIGVKTTPNLTVHRELLQITDAYDIPTECFGWRNQLVIFSCIEKLALTPVYRKGTKKKSKWKLQAT